MPSPSRSSHRIEVDRRGALLAACIVGATMGCASHPSVPAPAAPSTSAAELDLVELVTEHETPSHATLAERMAHHHVPAVSIAVVHQGVLVWARAFGARKAGTNERVDTDTLFQAASIGKPVTEDTSVLGFRFGWRARDA